MAWLAVLKAILGLAGSLAAYLNNKQLLDAGEAQAIVKSLNHAKETINKATAARNKATSDFDDANGLPNNDDPNLRD